MIDVPEIRKNAISAYFKKTDEYINDIINKRLTALIIGAGVTSCLIGDWNELLDEGISLKVKNKQGPVIRKYLSDYKVSFVPGSTTSLEKGEYLMFDSDDTEAQKESAFEEEKWRETLFAAQIREAIKRLVFNRTGGDLFSTFKEAFCGCGTDTQVGPKKISVSKFQTLIKVVKLCVIGGVSEIVTYNFDTVLDHLLNDPRVWELFGKKKDKKIQIYSYFKHGPLPWADFDCCNNNGEECIKIYHVHGVLDDEIDEVHPIIFSENSYEVYQHTLLNWSNLILTKCILNHDLILLGFSGDDSNFRQMARTFLQIRKSPVFGDARRRGIEMYLFMNAMEHVEKLIPEELLETDADTGAEIAQAYMRLMTDYYYNRYGVLIVAMNGFDDLAMKLDKIAEAWRLNEK